MKYSLLTVSFVPTDYVVTEGVDLFANVTLIRSGNTNKTATVIVCTQSGTANGMSEYQSESILTIYIIVT